MKQLFTVFPVRVVLPLVFLLFLTGAAATYQVSGTVVNEQGEPLAERTVHLYNAADDLIDTAASDAEGVFRLSYERQPTSADPEDEWPGAAIPSTFKLGASYPNPFNPQTTVPFYAPEQTSAVIGVYNILGQQIVRKQTEMARGVNQIRVNLDGVSQGQYLLRVVGQGFSETGSMTFISTGTSAGRSGIRVRSGGSMWMRLESGDVIDLGDVSQSGKLADTGQTSQYDAREQDDATAQPGGAAQYGGAEQPGETEQSDAVAQPGGTAQSGQVARLTTGSDYRMVIQGDDTYLEKEVVFQPYEEDVFDAGQLTLFYKEFHGGDGTEENPYLVATPQQLNNVREHRESHFRQIADIDLTGFSDGEDGWDPIGRDARRFRGSYDGDDFEISGLYINRPDRNNIGLFASLEDADIRNLSLVDVDITGRSEVGALAGRSERREEDEGAIEQIFVSGTLTGYSFHVGGLIGAAYGERISHCETDLVLVGDGNMHMNLGGMIGHLDGTLAHSTASGEIIAKTSTVGGLVGRTTSDAFILNGSSSMTITAEDNRIMGGLVGQHGGFSKAEGYIADSYATGDVSSKGDRAGGLVGSVLGGKIRDSYASGNVFIEGEHAGGLAGYNYNGTISNSNASGDVEGHERTGGLIGTNRSPITNCHAHGNVTGNGRHTGGLIGYNDQPPSGGDDPDITKCYAIGDVVGKDDNVGGLIGYNRRGEVLRSYAIGTVTGSENIVGGLIGLLMNGNVKQCYAHGNVSGVERVGGLVGDSRWRSVVESYSVGQVTGQEDIGGLIGADHGNNYERNYYDKDTSGMNDVENAIPLSTAEMQYQESFENWDFDTVWDIDEGQGYPYQLWHQQWQQ